jgi:hypothetical protein
VSRGLISREFREWTRFLTVAEVAAILKLNQQTVRNWIDQGSLPGAASSPSNKILWVMRLPRNGSQLVIRATPEHSLSPTIIVTEPADSGPGEIYPSIVNVPRSGCWHLQVRWAGHSDSVNLGYHAREQE